MIIDYCEVRCIIPAFFLHRFSTNIQKRFCVNFMGANIFHTHKHPTNNINDHGSTDIGTYEKSIDEQDSIHRNHGHRIKGVRRALTFKRKSSKNNNLISKSTRFSNPEVTSQRTSRSSYTSSSISSLSSATSCGSYSSNDSEASNRVKSTQQHLKVKISAECLPKTQKKDRTVKRNRFHLHSSTNKDNLRAQGKSKAELSPVSKGFLFSRLSLRNRKSFNSLENRPLSSKKSFNTICIQDNSSLACGSSDSLAFVTNSDSRGKIYSPVSQSNDSGVTSFDVNQRKHSMSLSLSKLKRRTKSFLLLNASSSSLLDLAKAGKVPSDSMSNRVMGDSLNNSSDGSKITFGSKRSGAKPEVEERANSTDHSSILCDDSDGRRESTSHESNGSSSSFSIRSNSRTFKKRSKTVGPTDKQRVSRSKSGGSSSRSSFRSKLRANSDSQVAKVSTERRKSFSKKDLPPTDGHIPSTYLDEVLGMFKCSTVALLLSLTDSNFMKLTLREYIRKYFNFSSLPLDIALREFLMINQLPNEVQQIDRIIFEFGRRYSEQHPELGMNVDNCYLLTYALVILHTDRFNPSNKHKMTRWEFIDNLLLSLKQDDLSPIKHGKYKHDVEAVMKETFGYLYDNTVYQQFVRIQEEQADEAFSALSDFTGKKFLPYPSLSTIETKSITTLGSGTSSTSSLKRRSSFLWLQPDLDIYQQICQRNIESLKLNITFNTEFPFIGSDVISKEKDEKCTESEILLDKLESKTSNILPSLASSSSKIKDVDNIKKQVCSSMDKINISGLDRILRIIEGTACSVVLKVPKAKGSFLHVQNSQILEYGSEDQSTGKDFYMVRVLKFGMVSRQESTLSLKSWKKYFCILTTIGMFFFKSLTLFKMTYLPEDVKRSILIFEEAPSNSAATNFWGSFKPALSIHWKAFATRMEKSLSLDKLVNTNMDKDMIDNPLRSYTFYIYTENSRSIYMVDNLFELKLWITQINYMSALASVSFPIKKIPLFDDHSNGLGKTDHDDSASSEKETNEDENVTQATNTESVDDDKYQEIACQAALGLDDRLKELDLSIKNSIEALQSYFAAVQMLKLLTPLQAKTREELLSSSKIINAKLEWLWYELTEDIEYHRVLFALKEHNLKPSV